MVAYFGARSTMNPSKKFGIRAWLMSLAVLTMLPVLLFSSLTLYQIKEDRQEFVRLRLKQGAQATAYAVKERLGVTLGYLNALASSEAALRNDRKTLYEHAKRLVALNEGAVAISLIDASGSMLFNTRNPFDHPRMPATDAASVEAVFRDGRPSVSASFTGALVREPVVALAVPVFHQDKVVYCLRMVIKGSVFNTILQGKYLSPEWISAIAHTNGVLVARNKSPEIYVGQKVTGPLQTAIDDGVEGIISSISKEGIAVQTAVYRVPGWDWVVAIAVPTHILNEPVQALYREMMLFGLFTAVLFLVVAARFASWLGRPIENLSTAAKALGAGD